MSTINYAFKEVSCKIVYYGPGLGGKTTNLIRIHETIPGRHRGDLVSLATEQDRTLFFDFLPVDLGEVKGFRTKFQLYTVPGQVFYNATRKLVLRGVDGLVFVADSSPTRMEANRQSWENMLANLAEYGYDLTQVPLVLQYNKRDLPDATPVEELDALLNQNGARRFEAIAIQGVGVKETLKGISSLVLARLQRVTASAPAAADFPGSRLNLPVGGLARPTAAAAPAGAPAGSDRESRAAPTPVGMPPHAPLAAPLAAPAEPATAGAFDAGLSELEPVIAPAPQRPAERRRPLAAEAAAPATPGRPAGPPAAAGVLRIAAEQACDLYWGPVRVGRGGLSLQPAARENGGRAVHALTLEMVAPFIGHRRREVKMRHIGYELRSVRGQELRFATFGNLPDPTGSTRKLLIWVHEAATAGEQTMMFAKYYGRLLRLTMMPEGKGRLF